MQIGKIFSVNLINDVKVVSKDSKIYEAFKPYLQDVLGTSLDEYMKDKELRREYRQKFAKIKEHFQKSDAKYLPIREEECLRRIAKYAKEWSEFILVARESTLDSGKGFIERTPLDKYILMSSRQKDELERQLMSETIKRIRSYANDSCLSNAQQLNEMLVESKPVIQNSSHRI